MKAILHLMRGMMLACAIASFIDASSHSAFIIPMPMVSVPVASGPTLVSSTSDTKSGATCGESLSIGFATSPANGNLIVLATSDTTGTDGAFSGFTAATGGTSKCRVYYKIASSESNSYSYSYNGTSSGDAAILQGFVISGVNNPVFDVSGTTSNTASTANVTTTVANDIVVSIGGSHSATTDFATPVAPMSLIKHDSVNGIGMGSSWTTQAAATATGNPGWNAGSYASATGFTIGFRTQ